MNDVGANDVGSFILAMLFWPLVLVVCVLLILEGVAYVHARFGRGDSDNGTDGAGDILD